MKNINNVARGDRTKLTFDQRALLENNILPAARRWLDIPTLKEHGEATLAYWGEEFHCQKIAAE